MIRLDLGVWRSRQRRREKRRRQHSAISRQFSAVSIRPYLEIVILSEAKDLLSWRTRRQQVLRFAQDDSSLKVDLGYAVLRSQAGRLLSHCARWRGERAAVCFRTGVEGSNLRERLESLSRSLDGPQEWHPDS